MGGVSEHGTPVQMISFLSLFFTDRISNEMQEGSVFTGVCPSTVRGGGGRLTPSPSHNTSTGPISFLGSTPVTGLRSLRGGGTPMPGRGSTPYWGTPHPPRKEQQSVLLLSGGRYASCFHAGGLSWFFFWFFALINIHD